MSSGGSKPQEYKAAAQADMQANRPNQSNPWASSQWTQDAQGNWSQTQGFNGPLAGASDALAGQAAANFATPFDMGQFGPIQDGSAAREEATSSAYNEATRRLDPQWRQREEATRAQLANQGLDPNSEAARGTMGGLEQARSDAYGGAMSSAIAQGQQAGDSVFRNNLMSRQQAIAEALRQRGQPLQEMQALQGFLGQPGFATGNPNMLALQGAAGYAQNKNQMWGDVIGAGASLGGAGLFALSDVRAKQDVQPLGYDVLPGVPAVAWTYRAGLGPPGRHTGVLAQDVQRVRPDAVRRRPDGLLEVDYSRLPEVTP